MLVPSEFWDVRSQENAHIRQLEAEVETLTRAIQLAKANDKIRNSLGYNELLTNVQSLLDLNKERLVKSVYDSNESLREQRGKVQALTDIVDLMTRKQSIQHLEDRLSVRQNALEAARTRRPQPREV
jgi:two-component sensor histidine kinase